MYEEDKRDYNKKKRKYHSSDDGWFDVILGFLGALLDLLTIFF